MLRDSELATNTVVRRAISLTAYGRSEDRQRALSAGFDEHVAKPTDSASLAAVIATVLAARR